MKEHEAIEVLNKELSGETVIQVDQRYAFGVEGDRSVPDGFDFKCLSGKAVGLYQLLNEEFGVEVGHWK